MLQRTLPAGFIAPCLPTKTDKLPSGSQWLHEIKHDGFRIIARKNGERVRLYSRPGNDLTHRFPLIVDALSRLRSRSCIIDGEAVACDDNGVAGQDQGSFFRCQTAPWKYSYMLGGVVSLCSLAMCVCVPSPSTGSGHRKCGNAIGRGRTCTVATRSFSGPEICATFQRDNFSRRF